jgi:N-hydroxyarylamine O-acetyltransferase
MDVQAYLDRINYRGDRTSTYETLRALHLAHVLAVPFENLDNFLGRPISLEPPDLFAKIVTARRGGYCYELNGLFSLLLEAMGFPVTRLIARVWYGARPPYPRSHQVLLVHAGGESWLTDVGFGGNGLLEPFPFSTGHIATQCSEQFRLTSVEQEEHLLQCLVRDQWESLYSFSLHPCQPVDYRYASYFHSHSPDSIFMQRRICTMPTKDGRKTLVDQSLNIRWHGKNEKSVAGSDSECTKVLREHFGIVL